MTDPPVPMATPVDTPIFDFDIACPSCQYNLRGLTRRLCPECGNAFEPHAVLMAHRDNQPPLRVLWVLRNMYAHPLAFWRMPEVKRSRGPRRLQIFFLMLYLPLAIASLCGFVVVALLQRASPIEILILMVSTPFYALFGTAVLYVFCLIHGILCRVGLAMSREREGVRAAKEIVGYGVVWLTPVAVASSVVGRFASSFSRPGGRPWDQAWAILALGAGAAACLAWAITLYKGGKFASGGSRLVGIWCVVCNPFWYILGFALAVLFFR